MASLHLPPGNDGPVNEGERRVLAYLKENLPDSFELHPNLQVSIGQGQLAECDIIAFGPDCMWLIEVKDIAGVLRITEHECYVNHEVREHPVHATRRDAQKIKSRLSVVPNLAGVWIQPLVILAREPRALDLADTMKPFVVKMPRAVQLILDPTLVGRERGRLPDALRNQAKARLSLDSSARVNRPRFNGYRCDRLESDSGDRQWWRASHELMGTTVLLEVVKIDRVLSPSEQQQRRAEAFRAARVRSEVGTSEFLHTPDNAFLADDGSVVVVHPTPPASTLAASEEDVRAWDDDKKRRIVYSIASAVALLAGKNVVHRTIGPECIYVRADGSAALGGFSLAGFHDTSGKTVTPEMWGALGGSFFDAPEHLSGGVGLATDVFALGSLIRYLWPDGPPEELAGAADVATRAEAAKRDITADQIAKVARAEAPATPVAKAPVTLEPEAVLGGRYQLVEQLGAGATSTVWKAVDTLNAKAVALKVFNRPDAGAAAQREYAALEEVMHPGVVKARYFGSVDGLWMLITEFLDGPVLRLAMPPLAPVLNVDQAVSTALRLLAALEAIHPDMPRILELAAKDQRSDDEERLLDDLRQKGITHRDVKPENIILANPDQPVLVDFGLAASGTQGEAGGTAAYRPAGAVSTSADPDLDMFAVGVIVHELLTGRHPYTDADPMTGTLDVDAALPDHVRDVISRACSPRYEDRFRSAQEFIAALVTLGVADVPLPQPQADHVNLMKRIQEALAECRWDDAEELCPAAWTVIRERIARRRALDEGRQVAPPLLEIDGFELRFVETRRFEKAQSTDKGQVGPGVVRVYSVNGPHGELLEIGEFFADTSERWIGVTESYDTPLPLSRLKQGLRIGIASVDGVTMMELRQAQITNEQGWSAAYGATAVELDAGAGVSVEEVLRRFGCTAYGTRSSVFGDIGNRRNQMCMGVPDDAEHLPAVAYFLTRVMPLARGVTTA